MRTAADNGCVAGVTGSRERLRGLRQPITAAGVAAAENGCLGMMEIMELIEIIEIIDLWLG